MGGRVRRIRCLRRKPNTDAIAAMALDNYLEMRERVADPKFQLQQALSLELERRFPRRFIPRYSMVMFHHEIPYHIALERGRCSPGCSTELTAGRREARGHGFRARGARDLSCKLAAAPLTLLGSVALERDEAVGVGILVVRRVVFARRIRTQPPTPPVREKRVAVARCRCAPR